MSLWASVLDSCSIVWHIHIPKTAGTSVREVLLRAPGYVEVGAQYYVAHGSSRFWQHTDLRMRARSPRRYSWTLVSAEIGISDLVRLRYPWLNETCFFAVLRDPRQWLLSAENHMRADRNYDGRGVRGSWGYFDRPDIQSFMTGYNAALAERATDQPAAVCVATLEGIEASILPHLFPGQSAVTLPHANAKPHDTKLNATQSVDLDDVLARKYAHDSALWEVVRAQRVVCW